MITCLIRPMRSHFRHQQTINMSDRKFASIDKDEIDKIMQKEKLRNARQIHQ
jgi:predicted component of type VI protein secretion system